MKKTEAVGTIMTKHVYTVQLNDKLFDVYDMVRKHHIRHIPVIHKKHLVGIISRNDLDRLAFSDQFAGEEDADEAVFEMLNIGQVMTSNPRVVKVTDPIQDVAKILSTEEFHALPVVDEKDATKLAGIVTTTDVIKYLLKKV
jgi:CBS domain-containing protein